MLALPISKSRFKALSFYQNNPKIKLFLQKNAKFSSAGGFAPRPPCLRRLGAWPPDPQISPLHCEFLATRLSELANNNKKNFNFFNSLQRASLLKSL